MVGLENVLYQIRDDTAWLTMNRPDVLNALSKDMFRELEQTIRKASRDPKIFTIGIKGSGRAFSAGLDIRQVSGFTTRKEAREFVYDLVKPFWQQYLQCDKPIVSVVDGPAYGAGAEIALASDIVIASTRSSFAFSGGRVGALCCISAAFGHMMATGRKVTEMNLTGRPLSAQEALTFGLVNYVEESAAIDNRTEETLAALRHVSPTSNASFKRINRASFTPLILNVAYRELLRTITSQEFRKGAIAFAEKKVLDFRS
jgi:enoyl-CoA hydratase/3-hydroxyacyl-CoA dehydrogenase